MRASARFSPRRSKPLRRAITVAVTTFAAMGAPLLTAAASSSSIDAHEWGPVEVVADKVGAESFGPLFVLPDGDSVLVWIDYRGPLRADHELGSGVEEVARESRPTWL